MIFWFFEISKLSCCSIFLISVNCSLNSALFSSFKSTNRSIQSSFFLKNCLIGKASKNSLAKKIIGCELTFLISLIQLIFSDFKFTFCLFIKKSLFSCIKKLQLLKHSGKFLSVAHITFIISPFPAPNSSKLNFLGEPILFQKVTTQMAIISEKSLVIFGAVIKSPSFPKGFFFM